MVAPVASGTLAESTSGSWASIHKEAGSGDCSRCASTPSRSYDSDNPADRRGVRHRSPRTLLPFVQRDNANSGELRSPMGRALAFGWSAAGAFFWAVARVRHCGRGGGIRRQSERPGLRHPVRNASVPSSAVGVSVLDLADPPELIALFVEPELIGNGIGPVLLGKLIDRARAAGAEHCWSRGTPTRSRLPALAWRANGNPSHVFLNGA